MVNPVDFTSNFAVPGALRCGKWCVSPVVMNLMNVAGQCHPFINGWLGLPRMG